MKKTFNWGHGIFLFYVIFVGIMITVVIASTKVDRGLVMKDYYSLDLDYQNRYDQIQNGLNHNNVEISYDASKNIVSIIFPNSEVQGEIHFYRPSNNKLDFKNKINGKHTEITTQDLLEGYWTIKLKYQIEGTKFFKETKIFLT